MFVDVRRGCSGGVGECGTVYNVVQRRGRREEETIFNKKGEEKNV